MGRYINGMWKDHSPQISVKNIFLIHSKVSANVIRMVYMLKDNEKQGLFCSSGISGLVKKFIISLSCYRVLPWLYLLLHSFLFLKMKRMILYFLLLVGLFPVSARERQLPRIPLSQRNDATFLGKLLWVCKAKKCV